MLFPTFSYQKYTLKEPYICRCKGNVHFDPTDFIIFTIYMLSAVGLIRAPAVVECDMQRSKR